MSNNRYDPTASVAIGAVDKEIRRMEKRAKRIQEIRRRGRLTPEAEARARQDFTGIYRHLLKGVLED